MRFENRRNDQMRNIKITRNYTKYADGSVLIETGDTIVLCTASIEERTASFLKGTGDGWIVCEYSMLPRSTLVRKPREITKGKVDGRSIEIQRMIGRSLRSVVNLKALGEKTIWIDCDVIQADGGTRTASISGAFVALVDAVNKINNKWPFKLYPIRDYMAAVSVGIVNDIKMLDLCYSEDSNAKVDMNIIMTSSDEIVEIQGTGEQSPFSKKDLDDLVLLGQKGIKNMINAQKQSLKLDGIRIGTEI